MRDPYTVLGLGKSADKADIKRAYRKLAKANHPDRQQGDAGAQDKFAEISQAYEILGDKDKRAQFDAGAIDADGNPKFGGFGGGRGGQGGGFGGIDPRAFAQAFGGGQDDGRTFRFSTGQGGGRGAGQGAGQGAGRGNPSFEAGGFEGAEDLLGAMFGGRGGRGGRATSQAPAKAKDVKAEIAVTLEDIVAGTKVPVTLPGGKTLGLALPKGVRDGQVIRLKGQGESAAQARGKAGDALVTVKFVPHPQFKADGIHLRMDLPVDLADAVLGARVAVPTLDAKVQIRVPAQSSSGTVLRLKGKGLPGKKGQGDLLVRLAIALPEAPDAALTALMEKWQGEEKTKAEGEAED